MGRHYVPQAHLRRFEIVDRPGFVWMYDKKHRNWREASIKKVAQEDDYYSAEVEDELAQVVELPANKAISKLIDGHMLDDEERVHLALYMLTMHTRGPRQRKKVFAQAPTLMSEVIERLRQELEALIGEGGDGAEVARSKLEELSDVEVKFGAELPQKIIDLLRKPFWSERTVGGILEMRWHVIRAGDFTRFVTCDTPSHYFEAFGVGNEESEFTFPLSTQFALFGERLSRPGTTFEKPNNRLAREANRRILSHTDRFVFSSLRETWVETVVHKSDPYLSRIIW
jgi:hypothetical protein